MGIGISNGAAALWATDEVYGDSFNDYFLEKDDEYSYFSELPDWAYDENEGPFYIIGNSIYAFGMTPSQDGALVGNLTD